MFLTTVLILGIASVAGGVRVDGGSITISSSGSVTEANLTDLAGTWSQSTLATSHPFSKSTTLKNATPFKNATHVEASEHNAVIRQRRNALSEDALSTSLLNLSHEGPQVERGQIAVDGDGQYVLTLPDGNTCILQTSIALGVGAYGSVYACEGAGSQVAVKFVKKVRTGDDPESEYRKQRSVMSKYVVEAIAMFRLDIEETLRWESYFDGETIQEQLARGTLCIVMEKMDQELFNVMKLGSPLTKNEELTKWVWSQLLVAVMRIQEAGMIFRDLKPENILCEADISTGMTVKLTDFGLAKFHTAGNEEHDLCGTPEYMAPEQLKLAEGSKAFGSGNSHGFAVDAWELGALLYEFYVGIPPFYGQTSRAQMYTKILKGSLRVPRWVPGDLKHLLENLLQKDPAKRLCIIASSECRAKGLVSDHKWVKDTVATLVAADAAYIAERL